MKVLLQISDTNIKKIRNITSYKEYKKFRWELEEQANNLWANASEGDFRVYTPGLKRLRTSQIKLYEDKFEQDLKLGV